jgi:hypothetical protein
LRINGNLQSRENEKRACSPSGYDVALFAERLAQAKPDEIIAGGLDAGRRGKRRDSTPGRPKLAAVGERVAS